MPNQGRGNFSTAAKAQARRVAREALYRLGRQWKKEITDRINVPVERLSRHVVIRSDPGEPPRRETGALYKSVHFSLSEGSSFEDLRLYTTSSYGPVLHFGRAYPPMEPRPWWPEEPEVRQKRALLKRMIAEALKRQAADPSGALPSSYRE